MPALIVTWPDGSSRTITLDVTLDGPAPTGKLKTGKHTFGRTKGQQFTVTLDPGPLEPATMPPGADTPPVIVVVP